MPKEKATRHYIMSPHDDVNNFVNNTVGMGTHKASRGKPMIKPVFKDSAQRKAFNKEVSSRLKGVKDKKSDEYKALDYLKSRSGWFRGRMNFKGTKTKNPRVYVQGHGSAGSDNMVDDSGNRKSSKQVAKTLTDMHLSNRSNVRVNSCQSGSGTLYKGNDWMTRFHNGTLDQVSDTGNSFASNLHQELSSGKYTGTTMGYLTSTTQSAYGDSILQGQGGKRAKHMQGTNPFDTSQNNDVRRKHVRVDFN